MKCRNWATLGFCGVRASGSTMVITQVDFEDARLLSREKRDHCGGWSVSGCTGLISSTFASIAGGKNSRSVVSNIPGTTLTSVSVTGSVNSVSMPILGLKLGSTSGTIWAFSKAAVTFFKQVGEWGWRRGNTRASLRAPKIKIVDVKRNMTDVAETQSHVGLTWNKAYSVANQ